MEWKTRGVWGQTIEEREKEGKEIRFWKTNEKIIQRQKLKIRKRGRGIIEEGKIKRM